MRLDLIRAIEACYAGAEDDASWLREIVGALAPLDQGAGVVAQILGSAHAGRRAVEATFGTPAFTATILERVDESFSTLGRARERWTAGAPLEFALRGARQAGAAARREIERLFAAEGLDDAIAIFAAGRDGRIARVAAPIRHGGRRPSPRTLHQLKLFSAHLAASMRLRCAVCAAAGAGPDGPIPGTPSAAGGLGRESLADAVRRLEQAPGPLRRSDPDEALRLWEGLVGGTWSLVDRIDRDGRRYVLVRRNPPELRDPKALTERERAVVAFAALGHQNKLIGYLLGLGPSAIAAHLASARRKLRLASRSELVREFAALVAPGSAGRPTPPGPRA